MPDGNGADRDPRLIEPDTADEWSVPSWMHLPPTDVPAPPVEGLESDLPIASLSWESFERLCLRLLAHDSEILLAAAVADDGLADPVVRPFGLRGQHQAGIDLYARDPLADRSGGKPARRHTCVQARRTEEVTRSKIEKTVSDFVAGPWAESTRRFIYATSGSVVSTTTTLGIEGQATRLGELGIAFEVWDSHELSSRLRDLPNLVHEFFGVHWVRRFCGDDAANRLRARLDGADVATLRRKLRSFYSVTFRIADPGGLLSSAGTGAPVPLASRFVTPDLSTSTVTAKGPPASDSDSAVQDPERYLEAVLGEESLQASRWAEDWSSAGVEPLEANDAGGEDRTSASAWIGTSTRQAVVGDPGAGKSTLLRHLVLDLLSEEPSWHDVAERWGNRLPIWLPFHFFTQRAQGQTGEAASISSALKAWFEQHDVEELWPLAEAALADERLLLVVDGLDEWIDADTGRSCAAALETFVGTRSAAAIVSTRPYALNRLTLGADWAVGHIVGLSRSQQRTLATRHFAIASGEEVVDGEPSEAGRAVEALMADLEAAPELRHMSRVPLFFVLLLGLRIARGARLPERRFDLYEDAIRLLIADQPERRRSAARVTAAAQRLSDRQTRKLLAGVAYRCQGRGELSSIAIDALRNDIAEVMRDPDGLAATPDVAAQESDRLVDVVEGDLGLLVRTGPETLGFLHRVLQEQLAAEHAASALSIDDLESLFEHRSGDPAWHEVLMSVLWRLERPNEVRRLAKVIASKIDESPSGLRAREMLAEVVFGQFGLPGSDVHEYLPGLIDAIETHPYGPHRARLLDETLAGLGSPTTGPQVTDLIGRWALAPQAPSGDLAWQAASLRYHPDVSDLVCELLISSLRLPNNQVAQATAISIAARCSEDGPAGGDERDRLRAGVHRTLVDPPNGASSVAALVALALEWRDEEATDALLQSARRSTHVPTRLVGLADALGLIDHVFRHDAKAQPLPRTSLTAAETEWIRGLLDQEVTSDAHHGLLVALVSAVVKDDDEVRRGVIDFLVNGSGPSLDLMWGIAFNAFGSDPDVAAEIARQVRDNDHAWPLLGMATRRGNQLIATYAAGTAMNETMAEAVEHRLRRLDTRHHDVELHALAGIDSGPMMRQALLQHLDESTFPHWRASALAEFWPDDAEIGTVLRKRLEGDPVAASQIAGTAGQVLGHKAALHRLLEILEGLQIGSSNRERPDIVAAELVRVVQTSDQTDAELDSIAHRALGTLLPRREDPSSDSPFRHVEEAAFRIASGFSTTPSALAALDDLASQDQRPLEQFLFAYRTQPTLARPFLTAAVNVVRALPSTQRARLSRHLAERAPGSRVVVDVLDRWSDEVADVNRSVLSLAYHRALKDARAANLVDDDDWDRALGRLRREAAAYGPALEARRRAAWVGMCVLGDWTPVDDLVERIGDEKPVTVGLSDPFAGPDPVLVQEIARTWVALRSRFGEGLLKRFSGRLGTSGSPWGPLALGANQSQPLEAELRAAVTKDPDLMKEDGVFVWLACRASVRDELVTSRQLRQLRSNSNVRSAATRLLSSSTRIELPVAALEEAIGDQPAPEAPFGDDLIEILASRAPDHPRVREVWEKCRPLVDPTHPGYGTDSSYRNIHPLTYLSVAYAAVDAERIVWLLERDHRWLSTTSSTYFDSAFSTHAIRRLRRDSAAAAKVRNALLSSTTRVEVAAMMAPLYASAVSLDDEIEATLIGLALSELAQPAATLVRDHTIEAVSSARMAVTRALDLGRR